MDRTVEAGQNGGRPETFSDAEPPPVSCEDAANTFDIEPLLEAVRRGDRAAWDRLVESVRPQLLAVARQVFGGRSPAKVDVSGVVQEGLLTAFRQIGQLRGGDGEQLLAWLKVIVRRQALDALRSVGRAKRRADREQPLPEDSAGAVRLAADISSPSQRAVRHEEEERRRARRAQLPPDYQTVLRLRIDEDRDWEEIALVMGRTAKAVQRLYYRAAAQWAAEEETGP
jgi:RNA polymerase sigma factor (sigma-70 family)